MNIETVAKYLNSKKLRLKTKKRLIMPLYVFLPHEKYRTLRHLLKDNYDELIAAEKGIFFNEKRFNSQIEKQVNHAGHEASLPAFVEANLKRIRPKRSWKFLDAGCGTGFVLWKASSYFSKVVGVEYMPELAQMARENLKKLSVQNAEVICDDICNVSPEKLKDIDVFYMYNPFQGEIMETFIKNIVQSIRLKDRDLYIIYVNDVCAEILSGTGGGEYFTFISVSNTKLGAIQVFGVIREGIMNRLLIDLVPFSKLRKKLKDKYFPKDFSMEKMKHCLMVAPHPDDETLGAGGLLIKWHEKFDCVCMASSGVQTPQMNARDRADVRLKEFETVMNVIGIQNRWIFNTFGVPPMNDQIQAYFCDYCRVLDTSKYDCFFLPHPQDNHEEHRFITNKLFKRVLKKNSYKPYAKVVFYEVWTPLERPNYFEDISEVAEDKQQILNLYASQFSPNGIIPRMLGLNVYRGVFNQVRYAEAFRVCDVEKYLRG